MAALRRGVCAGRREDGAAKSKWVRAKPVDKHRTCITFAKIRATKNKTGL
jgi:hypothetical protein